MMKKLSPRSYQSLFLKHLWRFLSRVVAQAELAGNHAVAVSGGPDSMALLWVAIRLRQEGKLGPVRAIFVNHQTREGQHQEGELVRRFCADQGILFTELLATNLRFPGGNFEARARRERRRLCLEALGSQELLWIGHHLDDSFEWNFMQRHRSAQVGSALGIPVRNHKIVRPLLCVSRAQIERLVKISGLPSALDPTNSDVRFDRNYVRGVIAPLIRARYPKYLKLYAQSANTLAQLLNVSLLAPRIEPICTHGFENGVALEGKCFSSSQIQSLIHQYSLSDRGEISTPVDRMLLAIENRKKGPFHFSGGVEAYYSPGLLLLYRRGFVTADSEISAVLRQLSTPELEAMGGCTKVELQAAWDSLLQRPDALSHLPGLVLVLDTPAIRKTLNTSVYDPLFPEVSKICQEKGLRFVTFRKCLDTWTQKQERLPETLGLVPLYNLSNLFTSQR